MKSNPRCRPAHSMLLVLLTPLVPILTGCLDRPSVQPEVVVDTLSSGAVRVLNPSPETWNRPSWNLVEEVRIGSADGDGPDVFGQIVGIEVDEEGRMYVLDALARELRIFDRTGEHVRTVGRRGPGPGEFESVTGLAWDPEGNLWVQDSRSRRFTVFDREGELKGTVPHGVPGLSNRWLGGIDATGSIWERALSFETGPQPEEVLFRMSLEGEVRETVPLPRVESPAYELWVPGATAPTITAVVPFAPILLWRIDDGGALWLGTSSEYRMIKRHVPGDTVLIVERDFEPVPVTPEERRLALESDPGTMSIRARGGDVDPALVPAYKPAITRFEPARDGTIWVWPSVAASEAAIVDIFSSEGQHLAAAAWPAEVADHPYPLIHHEYVVAVVTDELDVPSVVRYRIER